MQKIISSLLLVVGLGLTPLLLTAPAQAQATRTWISGVGDDVNPCSRTAPCKTFPGAISKTAAGGEINCLDPGGFGGVTITKSITLRCDGVEAGILVAGTNGITINAGPTDNIYIYGLDIDGGPPSSNSLAGIRFLAGGALHVQNCVIRHFTGGSPNGWGINFSPNSAAELYVTDTYISDNGNGSSGGGILVSPSALAGATTFTIENTSSNNNAVGVRVDNSATAAPVKGTIRDTYVSGNTLAGIVTLSGASGALNLMIDGTTASNNVTNGLSAGGASTIIKVGRSTFSGNGTGFLLNGGQIMTYGNNQVDGNTSNGAVSGNANSL